MFASSQKELQGLRLELRALRGSFQRFIGSTNLVPVPSVAEVTVENNVDLPLVIEGADSSGRLPSDVQVDVHALRKIRHRKKTASTDFMQNGEVFVPGRKYRSSQIMNDKGEIVPLGFGFTTTDENPTALYYQPGSGGRQYMVRDCHGKETSAPQPCFNCGEFHWRINCPCASGNHTL